MTILNVGLYFHPARSWDWPSFLAGEVGLSGTDAQVLRVAHALSLRDGIEVTLFQGQPPTEHPRVRCVRVASASEAVERAKELGLSTLVFNNRGTEETRDAIARAESVDMPVVLWDQNGPNEDMADAVANNRAIKRLVCVSAAQCDWVRHHPVFRKLDFIYNSVDPLFFYQRTLEKVDTRVAFLGSLTPAKGFHLIASAWPAIRAAVPSAELVVLGSAQLYDDHATLGPLQVAESSYELEHIIPHLGQTRDECAARGVTFRGLVTPREVRDELLRSSVGVVNPHCRGASIETFCVSAVELQACSAAVIGGRAGGLLETVRDGETGRLVCDQEELAEAVIALLRAPEKARALGDAGRRFVGSLFGPGAMADRWVQLLLEIDAQQPARPPTLRWAQADARTLLKEGLRRGRELPVLGTNVPSLRELRELRSRFTTPPARQRPG